MAGLLGGGMPQLDPEFIQQLMQQIGAQRANPMSRPIAGEQYLNGLGMIPPDNQMIEPGAGALGNMTPPDNAMLPLNGAPISTDFSGLAPGLPNLPDSFSGFGFGQTAPKKFDGQDNLRQQLIERLLSQIGNGMDAGMGGVAPMLPGAVY